MAKQYAKWIDVPDGNGGLERKWLKDAEARDAIGVDTSVEFVDLGLPSGTLWAKCNIGADSETEYGNYYMYGKGSTQYNSSDSAYTGTENPLAAEADTATQVLGAPWHMPTKEQFKELVDNTTYSWETNFNGSGINGGKFTAQNGNYIFIPAAGYKDEGSLYFAGSWGCPWSSTPSGSTYAYHLNAGSSRVYVNADNKRMYGSPVRPVCDSAPLNKVSDKADKKDTYTKQEVSDMVNSVVVGSQAVEMFTFEVDTATMTLKCYTTAAYAEAFKVDDGVLKLDISALSE